MDKSHSIVTIQNDDMKKHCIARLYRPISAYNAQIHHRNLDQALLHQLLSNRCQISYRSVVTILWLSLFRLRKQVHIIHVFDCNTWKKVGYLGIMSQYNSFVPGIN